MTRWKRITRIWRNNSMHSGYSTSTLSTTHQWCTASARLNQKDVPQYIQGQVDPRRGYDAARAESDLARASVI